MLNRWIAGKNSIVEWLIELPALSSQAGLNQSLEFAKGLILAGEREHVFRLIQTKQPNPFKANSGMSYVDYLRKIATETGILPLFNNGLYTDRWLEDELQAPGSVCYYSQDGKAVEAEVNNLGELLKQLRPQDQEEYLSYMWPVPPITVRGSVFKIQSDVEPWLLISLFTDIWFPKVIGLMEEERPYPDPKSLFDNSELANCHTPRLNRFLGEVRRLVLELGGTWKLEQAPTYTAYHSMVSEAGILLGQDDIQNSKLGNADRKG